MKHMHKNKTKASEFSPTPLKPTFTCFPHTTKAWTKVLKAASKHFKKKKKKDPTAHVKLSNNLRGEYFNWKFLCFSLAILAVGELERRMETK
ncbi:hypothetical protein ACJW30_09G106600 [Castanea mollissima]